jgi:hypothetical protein
MVRSAFSPFAVLRQASTTLAPRRASSRALTSPRPLLAPVTTAVRPLWSGICSLVHVALIGYLLASERLQGTRTIFLWDPACTRRHASAS